MAKQQQFDVNVRYETENGFDVSIAFRSGKFEVAYWYGDSAMQTSRWTDTLQEAIDHAELLAETLEAIQVEKEVMDLTRKKLRLGKPSETLYDFVER